MDVEEATTIVVVLSSGSSYFSACAEIPVALSQAMAVDAVAEAIAVFGSSCCCSSVAAATLDAVAFSNFIMKKAPRIEAPLLFSVFFLFFALTILLLFSF